MAVIERMLCRPLGRCRSDAFGPGYEHQRRRVFTHGMTDGIWTSARNVPALVLFHLESGMNYALGISCPPAPDLCLAH
jgi:hypothetical protein